MREYSEYAEIWLAKRSFDKADNIHSVGTKEVKRRKNSLKMAHSNWVKLNKIGRS